MSPKTAKVNIGLCNPKSPVNVGAVMRAAGCYRVSHVFYTGERYKRALKFNTDTKNVVSHIPLSWVDSFTGMQRSNEQVVCVEFAEGAIPLPEFRHPPGEVLYIFGPEDGTMDQQLINQADEVVYIPTVGCMNLAATVNVVLYDRLAKSGHYAAGDVLIRQSRDTNNRLKVMDD